VQVEPERGAPFAADGMRADQEDRDLARRLVDREAQALADAYARYGRVTFGFLLKTLRDRAAAEDVQQQVFLELWQRAPQFDPVRGSLITWVMTIARSRAIDQLRRRVPVPQDPTGSPALETPVESVVDELVEHWHMVELLRRLPHEEAELLRQRFYGGLSQSEIASETGVPLGTVKMRMVSGLRRLRAMMEPEEA
jgi:RNA polymerase sigma-70 factor, ECF subfamily